MWFFSLCAVFHFAPLGLPYRLDFSPLLLTRRSIPCVAVYFAQLTHELHPHSATLFKPSCPHHLRVPTMNHICYFEIQSSQPERDMAFYQAVFGWSFEPVAGLPIAYYRITTDGIHGGLLERPAATPPMHCGTNAFTCSIEMADFDATAALILAHGGQEAMPKFAIPNQCWQGYFLDADHNTFGIVEPNPNAQ